MSRNVGPSPSWSPVAASSTRRDSRAMRRAHVAVLIAGAALASPAWAAGGGDGSRIGPTLFALALLVTSAKVGGLMAERLAQPAVLGELLVGIGLGNLVPLIVGGAGVEIVAANPVLRFLAEVGVLILLFEVGL